MLVPIKGHGKEFEAYRTLFIHEYEMDLVRNHKLNDYDAHEKAVNIIDSSFLAEAGKNNNALFRIVKSIEGAQHNVGYIWILSSAKDNSAFIMDFYILPEYRKQSLGTEALTELFYQLAQNGNTAITLRVDPDNLAARSLYKKVGFAVTGINMARRLNSAAF